jgi:Fe-S-cluster-containing dehydrogenase component
MSKYGLIIDLTKCAGCRACTVACQMQNELAPYERWLRVQETESGKYPSASKRFLTVQCQHCDKAPCIALCPVCANYKRPDGIVMIDENRCVGCKYCMVACPYQARVFNEERGVAQKCWLCYTRVEKGVAPACVVACPAGARYFGDFDNPESEVSRMVLGGKAAKLRPDLATEPSLYYIR